jgi:hypothetical protein
MPQPSNIVAAQMEHGLSYARAHRNYVVAGAFKANPNGSRARLAELVDRDLRKKREVAAQQLPKNTGSALQALVPIKVHRKDPIPGRPGELKKVASRQELEAMRQHASACDHPSCFALWSGPWGPFIGGKDGMLHFDLTEWPQGDRLNRAIGWDPNYPLV